MKIPILYIPGSLFSLMLIKPSHEVSKSRETFGNKVVRMALKTNEKVKMSLYPSKFKVLMSD